MEAQTKDPAVARAEHDLVPRIDPDRTNAHVGVIDVEFADRAPNEFDTFLMEPVDRLRELVRARCAKLAVCGVCPSDGSEPGTEVGVDLAG